MIRLLPTRPGLGPAALLAACLTVAQATSATDSGFDELPSRWADLDGVRVHYRDSGVGSVALVFIHGWGCDGTVWRRQVPELLSLARALFVDLPGHGRSDKPAVEYSVDYLAAGVEAVIHHAGVERAILVGHSNGVPVARQYYRRHPSTTKALVVTEGSFRPLSRDPEQIARLIEPFRKPTYLEAVERMVPATLAPDLRARIRSMMRATPQHVLVGALEGVFDPAIWEEDPITVPTLVLLAASPFWTADYRHFVHRLVADVDYRVYEGAGHFLPLESPELFNRAVREFLLARRLLER